jgi:hypothetical protein
MINIETILRALKPSERSLIMVEPCGGKVLITIEPVKSKGKKKHTAVRLGLG